MAHLVFRLTPQNSAETSELILQDLLRYVPPGTKGDILFWSLFPLAVLLPLVPHRPGL